MRGLSGLKWFYIGVQFTMLLVSVPKVGMLFHAYDSQPLGPTVLGLDIRAWGIGIAIDLTAALTSWAAMNKYDATRRHRDLLAPGVLILACTTLSVIANFEDAALLTPARYQRVTLFGTPASTINPALISLPPILVFLLIVLVPSVLARPRVKSALEIQAETDEQEARILAEARLKLVRANANAEIRSAQVGGLKSTWNALRSTGSEAANSMGENTGDGADEPPPDGTDGGSGPHDASGSEAHASSDTWPHLAVIARAGNGAIHSTRNAAVESTKGQGQRGASARVIPLAERVRIAGGLAPQDVADVCQISRRYARELCARAHAQALPEVRYTATTPVPPSTMIAYLRSTDSRVLHVHADALARALKLRQSVRKSATPESKQSGSPQPLEADLHRRGLYALERTSEGTDGRLSSAAEGAEDDAAAPA